MAEPVAPIAAERAERAPQPLEHQFQSVFAEAADAMLILDDERRILEANRAAHDLFGLPDDPVERPRFDDFIDAAEDSLQATWHDVLAAGDGKREHRVASRGRTARLVECSYRARVQSADRHLCIARDITERRLLEERLIQSEKIESVGRLAGGIAHDFNNLLTAILGYTELLLSRHPDPDDPERSDLQEVQKAGQRAAALTYQLLAYSRKQVLHPREVDLNQTVIGLRSMLTRLIREDITLTCDLAADPAVVKIDLTQIEQVIVNLVLNSRDALPSGGFIRLETARVSRPQHVTPEPGVVAAEYIRLRVADNGVGITPEAKARIFEPFFTTKELGKGTGLGLASVYGIVRQSNGFINVESEPGAGTTFTMLFPALGRPACRANETLAAAPALCGRETILLVEDEDAVRAIAATVLRRHGYQVIEASHPGIACDLIERHAGPIDLLLTDVVMPDMSGPALAQRLIAARPDLRVLFMSGYSTLSLPLEAGNSHMSFLSKPFQASALTAKVSEILAGRQGAASPGASA